MARSRTAQRTTDDLTVTTDARGSDRLREAWDTRSQRLIRDDDVATIEAHLQESPATLSHVVVAGGEEATGLGLALSYRGDEIAWCGNDLQWLMELLRKLGPPSEPPRWIIDGKIAVDRVTVLMTLGVLPANAFDAVIPKLSGRQLGRFDGE